jgi:hypothetical protein
MHAYMQLLSDHVKSGKPLHVAALRRVCINRLQFVSALKMADRVGIHLAGAHTLDKGLKAEMLGMTSVNPRAY